MKIPSFLFLALIIPSSAFAHLVNYDSKAYLELAKGNQESANYIAHFCSLAAESVDDCMSRLIIAKGEVAAEKCGREIDEVNEKMKNEMHLKGGSPGVPSSGYFHTDYSCTKMEGCHRYGWTDGSREIAGRELGATFVSQARILAVKMQETETKTKEVSSFVEGFLKGVAGMLGSEVEVSVKGGGAQKDSSEKSVVKGGLGEYEIAKSYNAGFAKGWEDPAQAKLTPNVYFVKGEVSAVGSDGKTYKNDPNDSVPPIPKGLLKDEGPASANKPKDEPKVPSSSEAIPTDANKGASNSASTISSPWGSIQPGQDGELSPLQACYELEMSKIKKKEAVKTVEGDEETYAQQKENAVANLQLGFCDENFYGRNACRVGGVGHPLQERDHSLLLVIAGD
ncbi:MAG: hypothetical protein EOP04_26770, partial [Proteobacteria bacterium]